LRKREEFQQFLNQKIDIALISETHLKLGHKIFPIKGFTGMAGPTQEKGE
jgi:hypothetical protein